MTTDHSLIERCQDKRRRQIAACVRVLENFGAASHLLTLSKQDKSKSVNPLPPNWQSSLAIMINLGGKMFFIKSTDPFAYHSPTVFYVGSAFLLHDLSLPGFVILHPWALRALRSFQSGNCVHSLLDAHARPRRLCENVYLQI